MKYPRLPPAGCCPFSHARAGATSPTSHACRAVPLGGRQPPGTYRRGRPVPRPPAARSQLRAAASPGPPASPAPSRLPAGVPVRGCVTCLAWLAPSLPYAVAGRRRRRRERVYGGWGGELTLLNGDRAAASARASDRFTKQTEAWVGTLNSNQQPQ